MQYQSAYKDNISPLWYLLERGLRFVFLKKCPSLTDTFDFLTSLLATFNPSFSDAKQMFLLFLAKYRREKSVHEP